MLEPERPSRIADMMNLGEGLVSAIVQSVVKNKSRQLEMLKRDVTKLENIKPPFRAISYEEALDVLAKAGNPAKFGTICGDEETIISPRTSTASYDSPLSQRDQSVLHAARPDRPTCPGVRHDCSGS